MSGDIFLTALPNSAAGSFLHRFANPGRFLRLSRWLLPLLTVVALVALAVGIVWGLWFAPADWQQGDSVRIMYIHVPMAILASSGYLALAVCGVLSLVWRHPLADLAAVEIGPVGAVVTAMCLATGSLWGKPMWGTWWVWDARLTSVLVLFFLYLGHIALIHAFDEPQRGYRAAAVLAIAGAVDLPIIKYSVNWWNTLHQPDSISLTSAPTMSTSMLAPLFICMIGFSAGFGALVVARVDAAILEGRARQLMTRRLPDQERAA
ncbi:heme ABC transporter permease CcmC [Acetobacteraceae bacterium LMG 32668]|uniref:Heme exporter protein C n=1 Tax=Brytella acorum TaxID=2959299 RepID=A0AA35UHS0_9PROT|nr:heme ABC transporter permease CcmC [Brytella acorum]MDF3623529.1 heme ABC transporter permease CcmC [Brytella acorum]CAI9121614.1 heme ABC transporter permease CcmC [Brytella acorum]